MSIVAAYNAAIKVQELRYRPQEQEALAILINAGESALARRVHEHACAWVAVRRVVTFLVDKRPDEPDDILQLPPRDDRLERLIAIAQEERDAVAAEWPALYAEVCAVADRIETATPGAALADTGAV